jgi:hypothetical protein
MALEGILILSGKYDKATIADLGLPGCSEQEFIAHKLASNAERRIAKRHGVDLP